MARKKPERWRPRHSGDGGDGGDRPARQWEGSGRWWSRRFNAGESAAGRAHDIARQHQSLSSWSAARSRPWPADRDHGAAAEPRSSAGGGGDRCRAPPALRAAQRWRVGGAEGARRLGRARATCWTRIVQLRGGAAAAALGVGGWGLQRPPLCGRCARQPAPWRLPLRSLRDGAGPVGSTVPGCLSPPQLISIRSSEQLEELEESRNSAARNLGVWVDCLLASLERHILPQAAVGVSI